METMTVGGVKTQLWRAVNPVGSLPDLSEDDWRENATESVSDDGCYSVYRFDLGSGASLFVDCDQGHPMSASVEAEDMEKHLLQWEWIYMGTTVPEGMAAMGFNGLRYLIEPSADYQGTCAVWSEPNFYAGAYNAPRPGYWRDDDGAILTYPSAAEALAAREEYYTEPSAYDGIPVCNVLSHGQSGPHSLTVVKWEG